MGSMSLMHWIIVLVVVLLLFGSGKISSIMGDTAKGIKAFKKGMKDDDDTPVPPKTIDGTSGPAKEKDPAHTA